MQPELLCPRRIRFAPKILTSFAAQSLKLKAQKGCQVGFRDYLKEQI